MGILNKIFKNEKLVINTFAAILFTCGLLFGIVFYFYGNETIVQLNKYIFFYKEEATTDDKT